MKVLTHTDNGNVFDVRHDFGDLDMRRLRNQEAFDVRCDFLKAVGRVNEYVVDGVDTDNAKHYGLLRVRYH